MAITQKQVEENEFLFQRNYFSRDRFNGENPFLVINYISKVARKVKEECPDFMESEALNVALDALYPKIDS